MPTNGFFYILLEFGQYPIVMLFCLDPSFSMGAKQSRPGYSWLQSITGCIMQTKFRVLRLLFLSLKSVSIAAL